MGNDSNEVEDVANGSCYGFCMHVCDIDLIFAGTFNTGEDRSFYVLPASL